MQSPLMEKKGTVTQLSSMFPPEEAQKASKRVQEAIDERQQQLNQLKGFVDDNVSLINLVQKLPDETHHNIMVPFGKAAFFPGRLIHTNEFLVLLGEGYYADRTSKQTIEILKRRGKTVETQIESLKAIMLDLKTEASFFDTTANESAEGIVEIREDYVEDDSFQTPVGYESTDSAPVERDSKKGADEDDDEDFRRMQRRMDELEKEEAAAERANDESNEDEQTQNESASVINQEVRSSKVEALEVPTVSKDGPSSTDDPGPENTTMSKALEPPRVEKNVQSPLTAASMAFTGTIVEHPHNVGLHLAGQQSGTRGSKPVSRFKMQRK